MKLGIIHNGNLKEYNITDFEISYNKYQGMDFVLIFSSDETNEEQEKVPSFTELKAEGVVRPSVSGYLSEPIVTPKYLVDKLSELRKLKTIDIEYISPNKVESFIKYTACTSFYSLNPFEGTEDASNTIFDLLAEDLVSLEEKYLDSKNCSKLRILSLPEIHMCGSSFALREVIGVESGDNEKYAERE